MEKSAAMTTMRVTKNVKALHAFFVGSALRAGEFASLNVARAAPAWHGFSTRVFFRKHGLETRATVSSRAATRIRKKTDGRYINRSPKIVPMRTIELLTIAYEIASASRQNRIAQFLRRSEMIVVISHMTAVAIPR